MGVDVSPVRSRRDRNAFIELPYRLHANGTPWVPPLRVERRAFLNPRLNAYFKHADAELFLARRDGRVVGRVSAQIDHAFNEYQGNAWGMFGFLEFEDDQEILDALLAAAAAWLRARGRDRMVGPMDFSMNDESGILIEGFERDPMIRQPWHPPYYMERCEAADLSKAMDLLMWEMKIAQRDKILPIIFELAEGLKSKHGITIRKMSRRHLRRELDEFAALYNEAWARNWGFVPYSKADLDQYALDLQLVYDRSWFMVAETAEGETVGVAISIPDVNQVLKLMNGRIFPTGWLHYLRRRRIMDRCRIGFLGVKPAYQHTGVAAGFYIEHFDMAAVTPVNWGDAGWVLETNKGLNRGMEALGGQVVKRYRMYERELTP